MFVLVVHALLRPALDAGAHTGPRRGALDSDGVIHLAFVAPSVSEAATRTDATRHDKLAVRYEATLHVAAIGEWLRPLTS